MADDQSTPLKQSGFSGWDAGAPRDGGPAFPVKTTRSHPDYGTPIPVVREGMSLRDYFAVQMAAAMAGALLSSPHMLTEFTRSVGAAQPGQPVVLDPVIAKMAYDAADALLAERDRRLADRG